MYNNKQPFPIRGRNNNQAPVPQTPPISFSSGMTS